MIARDETGSDPIACKNWNSERTPGSFREGAFACAGETIKDE
jgi:hypothetical protein